MNDEKAKTIIAALLAVIDKGVYNISSEGATQLAGIKQTAERFLEEVDVPGNVDPGCDDDKYIAEDITEEFELDD